MKNALERTKTIIIAIAVVAGLNLVGAAWSNPTAAPTGGNPEPPINVGTVSQTKSGDLNVRFFNADNASFIDTPPIVGPTVTVGGAIKIGKSSGDAGITCNAGNEGALRYNDTGKTIEFCNSTDWKTMGTGLGGSQTYTSGSGQWTVPSGVISVQAEVWGAGGNGGYVPVVGFYGGGGGGYSKKTFTVTPGAVINYAIGVSGSNTSFSSITCVSGSSGNNSGAAGTCSGGTTNTSGNPGNFAAWSGTEGADGGAGANPGGGAGGAGAPFSGMPGNGIQPGGGGGVSVNQETSPGSGAAGRIILQW